MTSEHVYGIAVVLYLVAVAAPLVVLGATAVVRLARGFDLESARHDAYLEGIEFGGAHDEKQRRIKRRGELFAR